LFGRRRTPGNKLNLVGYEAARKVSPVSNCGHIIHAGQNIEYVRRAPLREHTGAAEHPLAAKLGEFFAAIVSLGEQLDATVAFSNVAIGGTMARPGFTAVRHKSPLMPRA